MHACIRAAVLSIGVPSPPIAGGVQALGLVFGFVLLAVIVAVTTLSMYHRRLPHVRWRSFELSFEDCHRGDDDTASYAAGVDAIGSEDSGSSRP